MHEDRDCDLWLENKGKSSLDKRQFGLWLMAEMHYPIRKPWNSGVGFEREEVPLSRQTIPPPMKESSNGRLSSRVAGNPRAETTQPDEETPVVELKSVLHTKSLLGDSERFGETLQLIDSETSLTADFVAPPKKVFTEVALNAKSNPPKKLPTDETIGSKIAENIPLRDDIGLQKDNGPSHVVASSAENTRPPLVDISNISGPKGKS